MLSMRFQIKQQKDNMVLSSHSPRKYLVTQSPGAHVITKNKLNQPEKQAKKGKYIQVKQRYLIPHPKS